MYSTIKCYNVNQTCIGLHEISTLSPYSETTCLPINEKNIFDAIKTTLQRLHGDYGMGCCLYGMTVKMFNPLTRIFIIRVHRGPHAFIASTLPFITNINGLNVKLTVLHLGGTIRSCLKFIMIHDRKKLDQLRKLCKDEAEWEEAKKILIECQQQFSGNDDTKEES